jgi:hypothetical protein
MMTPFPTSLPYPDYMASAGSILVYVIPAIVLTLVIAWIVVKVRHRFWSTQPVFHVYDLKYYLSPPGIIRTAVPEKTRYFHPDMRFSEIGSGDYRAFCAFIRRCYMRNGANKYTPSEGHIMPYFKGHAGKCHLGALSSTESLSDAKAQRVVQRPTMVACMTSRPMACELDGPRGEREAFTCNYVDYLCVDGTRRGDGLAAQAIYTHEYHNRRLQGAPVVSVFKREGAITGIVPICAYHMEGFDMRAWRPMPPLSASAGKVVRCTPATLYLAVDFIRQRAKTDFDLYLGVGDGNLAELLRTENVYLYLYVDTRGDIASVYFFRHTCTWLSEGAQVLACFASVRGAVADPLFIHAFKLAVTHILRTDGKRHQYALLLVENLSNNDVIVASLKRRTATSLREPAAYFFYNFAYRTFPANRCLVIN